MSFNLEKSESSFLFNKQKKEFLDWLESLRISKYWLDTMNVNESYALCNEIHQILKNFKELDLTEKEKLFSLTEINSCLSEVYDKLKMGYLESRLPLNKEHHETTQLIINTYMDLATSYYEVITIDKSQKNTLTEKNIALATCKGLQALGIVFLTSAQIYLNPPKGFWLSCYHLFNLAEKSNVLDNKVKIDNTIYSVAILFKRLIVFYIVDKNKFSPLELEQIFQSLLRGINYTKNYTPALSDEKDPKEIFGFSLNKDEPPSMQTNVSFATAKLLRYVNKTEVIKIIQFLFRETKDLALLNISKNECLTTQANPELFSKILASLEYKKKKHRTRIKQQAYCSAIIGLSNLVDFLLEKEGKNTLNNKTTLSAKQHENESDTFHLSWDLNEDHNQETIENSFVIENLQIIDSSINDYGILWSTPNSTINQLQVGEVIGVIPYSKAESKKIEIGLIRRIKIVNNHIIFGVELIGLESTLIYIERANGFTPGEWVLFLFGSPDYEVGILCSKKQNYKANDAIFVQIADKKVSCHLGPVLNSTPLLDHITLSY